AAAYIGNRGRGSRRPGGGAADGNGLSDSRRACRALRTGSSGGSGHARNALGAGGTDYTVKIAGAHGIPIAQISIVDVAIVVIALHQMIQTGDAPTVLLV